MANGQQDELLRAKMLENQRPNHMKPKPYCALLPIHCTNADHISKDFISGPDISGVEMSTPDTYEKVLWMMSGWNLHIVI